MVRRLSGADVLHSIGIDRVSLHCFMIWAFAAVALMSARVPAFKLTPM